MSILLRPYQSQFIADVGVGFQSYRHILGISPTGSGKTTIFSEITRRTRAKGKRIVLLAHRIEIVEQIGKALFRVGVMHGWIAPGHVFQKQPVMVAMVQSLVHRLDQIERPDLLIVDEAHHATAGQYTKIMDAWPGVFILGVTATPARTDGRGLGDCFDHMVFGPSMKELIARGYLAPFRYFATPPVADLSNLKKRGADFAAGQVADAMDRSVVIGDCIGHYAKHLDGAPAIAFCATVAHAEHTAEQFRAAGWKAASVDGDMTLIERSRRIRAIGDGTLNILTSCDVISEGTDIPAVYGALQLRPTDSLIVAMQQSGRVLRPKSDGRPAIILDHVNNVLRHGLPDADREWSLAGSTKRPAAPAVRQCPSCFCAFEPAPRCPACGVVFPTKARVTERKQIDADLQEVTEAQIQAQKQSDVKAALKAARSMADFQAVAKRFGYKSGWAVKMFGFYGKYRRAA